METYGYAAQNIDVGDPELGVFLHEGISSDTKDMGEIGSVMEALTSVDLDLAYSSEKLVNMEKILMHVLAWEIDFEALAADDIPVDSIEKALTFDLLCGVLESEVRELGNFMGSLQAQIVDARGKISSCRHLRELFIVVEGKLHDSEEALKQSQEHVLEMEMQLTKLQMTSLAFNHNDWTYNSGLGLSDDFQISDVNVKAQMQTVEQRHILRMLEKSLARELDLEKKLTESKQNEEDLKLKLRLTEQVALCMEEASEVVWGRFLEAENAAEVLMGISKELLGRLQILNFNRNGSIQREDETKSKLLDCTGQLKAKETAIEKLNIGIAQLIVDNSEVLILREKVALLEKQLSESESELKKVKASNEASQEQLSEMHSVVESLKENVFAAETRAETADTKISQITETNLELTEELGFLKGINDSNTKKVSLLEKQLREVELQLQHARASSEASQEQQNMLYSAIWDMETLIEELKQKVSKTEIKTENAEEQCIVLSESNLELGKEIDFLRERVESLETSLNQANVEKLASAKDIKIKTSLIMDMVMQLATERERIKKELYSLGQENRYLTGKLQKTKNDEGGDHNKDFPFAAGVSNATCAEYLQELKTQSSSKSLLVTEISEDAPACVTEVESYISANSLNQKLETERPHEAVQPTRTYIFRAILVLLLSGLATYLFSKKPAFLFACDG
ncbi:hypothetical protein RJ639_021482 [Escallonia herrerae]|uniref:WIT1/2 N-terminal helical bundle domain-containing protein n=1 Tax=Escallonia herrerae TaxID=1293975 RepID=A0AA89AF99_9ASTE|nr:hypothetical protein RJ639_021482 [Escallonia herrerae]